MGVRGEPHLSVIHAGLSGNTAEQRAEAGSIVETMEESWQRMSDFFWEQDPGRKEHLKTVLMSSYLPFVLSKLEKICAVNGSLDGWIVGSKVITLCATYLDVSQPPCACAQVTYADFAVCVFLETVCGQKPDVLNHFPLLGKLKNAVENLPRIKVWLEERPKTPF